jgi:hypothetical protein
MVGGSYRMPGEGSQVDPRWVKIDRLASAMSYLSS